MNRRLNIAKLAALSALSVALALPAAALAEYYVPPGNSAANQYTETLPSAGGESTGKGNGEKATPAKSLGARNAHRLEAKGQVGEEAAEVAAETAPPVHLVAAANGGQVKSPGPGHQGPGESSGNRQSASPGESTHVSQPSGSSGVGEIVAQATGSADDGNLGLWLPVVIVLTIAGSIAYRLRPRHGPTA